MSFTDLTLYWVDTDITTVTAFVNGLVLLCSQTDVFYGAVALAASLRALVFSWEATFSRANTRKMFQEVIVGPALIATVITSGGVTTTLNIESTVTGATTSVAHVPILEAVVLGGGTAVLQQFAHASETAISNVSTTYASISSTGTGFLNPLKILLGTRSAINDLGIIPSQVSTIVGTCLSPETTNTARVQALVKGAGNMGGVPSIPINGVENTALGVMLYQAQLTTSGILDYMDDITTGSVITVDTPSCVEAVGMVVANIEYALSTSDFQRAVQTSFQATDNPVQSANGNTIEAITGYFSAFRTSKVSQDQLSVGQQQANTEMYNLIYSEMVEQNLECLSAMGSNRTTCQGLILNRTDQERKNLRDAANAAYEMKILGAFGNATVLLMIMAFPAIGLLGIFYPAQAASFFKKWVEMVLIALMSYQVLAEIINAFMAFKLGNFLSNMAQGGFISQGIAYNAYTGLANQIGLASNLLSGLPQLLGAIVGIGSAWSNASSNATRLQDSSAAESLAPQAVHAAALMNMSPTAEVTQGQGFNIVRTPGSVAEASMNMQFGALSDTANKSVSASIIDSKTRDEGISYAETVASDISKGNSNNHTLSTNAQKALDKTISSSDSASKAFGIDKQDARTQRAGTSTDMSASVTGGWGVIPSISVTGKTGASASDDNSVVKTLSEQDQVKQSQERQKAYKDTLSSAEGQSLSEEDRQSISHAMRGEEMLQERISHTETSAQTSSEAKQATDALTAQMLSVGTETLAANAAKNKDVRLLMASEGAQFMYGTGAGSKAMDKVIERENLGLTDRVNSNDPKAIDFARAFAAANMVRNDNSASEKEKARASAFIAHAGRALAGHGYHIQENMFDRDVSMFKVDTGKMSGRSAREEKEKLDKDTSVLRYPRDNFIQKLTPEHIATANHNQGGGGGISPNAVKQDLIDNSSVKKQVQDKQKADGEKFTDSTLVNANTAASNAITDGGKGVANWLKKRL